VADAVIARSAPGGVIRTRAAFDSVRDAFSAAVVEELFQAVSLTARILTSAREVDRTLRSQNSLTLLGALNDVKGQVAGLVYPGFVARSGIARLPHLQRYLQAALERLRLLGDNPGRDRQRMSEFERVAAAYAEAGGTIPPRDDAPPALVRTRWLVEEYRVSLFAQHLGTAEPVSPQRIQKALRE
jgi:ATP-dependent helicase HrpA